MKIFFRCLLAGVACQTYVALSAQSDSAAAAYKTRDFQITWITPLSTNGLDAPRTINRTSLNIIGGINGGVNGFEAGGIANIVKGRVNGVQIAGMFNLCGEVDGAIQASGFANINKKQENTAALAGFMNYAGRGNAGAQASGFGNVAESAHVQAAGFFNVAQQVSGLQVAGFLNVVQDMEGPQAAGFINVAQSVKGIQAAGFLNIAQTVRGVQIGVINICDSIDGVPVGLVNIVRKSGFRQWEIGASESFHAQLAYKIGIPQFYTMLSGGVQLSDDGGRWGLGMGVGSRRYAGKRFYTQTEMLAYTVYEKGWRQNELNMLAQLKHTFSVQIAPRFELFIGPSLNIMISRFRNENGEFDTRLPPYALWEYEGAKVNLKGWVGATAGMRF